MVVWESVYILTILSFCLARVMGLYRMKNSRPLMCSKTLQLYGFPTIRLWAYLMKVILSVPDEGYFERTWWRLFWAYLMKVILSIPDDGYFERTWWRLFWAYLMKVILSVPDEGYFERTWWRLFWVYLMKVILSIPDERLFQKSIMHTRFDIYVFIACFLMFTLIDFLLAIPDY
jgi:hypothetical protein